MEDYFIPITWPEVQELIDYNDFRDNAVLITDGKLYQKYGDSAYLVNQEWYNRISILAMFESYLKKVDAYDRFIKMIKLTTLRKKLAMSPVDYVISSFGWTDVQYWKKIHNDWIEELFVNGKISDKEVSENKVE